MHLPRRILQGGLHHLFDSGVVVGQLEQTLDRFTALHGPGKLVRQVLAVHRQQRRSEKESVVTAGIDPQEAGLRVKNARAPVAAALSGPNHRGLRVRFVERLRGEEKFASIEALVAQMRVDVDNARKVLGVDS